MYFSPNAGKINTTDINLHKRQKGIVEGIERYIYIYRERGRKEELPGILII